MSRIPDRGQRGAINEFRRLEQSVNRVSSAVNNISNTGGGDFTRFDYEYDSSLDGVGVLPAVGDTVFYDPISQKVSREQYAKGSVGLSTTANLTEGNGTYRFALGKFDIIQTSDGKYWYAGAFGPSSRTGTGNPNFGFKIWEIVESSTGELTFDFGAFLLCTTTTVSADVLSISNIVQGAPDTFGVVAGNVDTAANTITFIRLQYSSGTWTLSGGGPTNDSSMGITHTNFDVRNGDLIYDAVQQEYLFFAVNSTSVAIERWDESTLAPQGVITLGSKTYSIDIPDRVNGFNIANKLSDGNYLVLDGTSAGNYIYSYNGTTFTATGTNNLTAAFMDGFNGVQLTDDVFVINTFLTRDSETATFTVIEYDADTTTLSQSTRQGSQNQITSDQGSDFDVDKQSFYLADIRTIFDKSGNSFTLDESYNIVSTRLSNGVGTAVNMSVKPIGGLLFYYSDFAASSSSGATEYATYHWTISQTLVGNLQEDRLPIELGTVTGVSGNNVTVDCLLVSFTGTDLVQGAIYNDFVAISTTRAIQLKRGASLPRRFPAPRAITDATSQEILLSGYQIIQVFNDSNILSERSDKEERYVFEFDKGSSVDNVNFNVLINGVPYYSDRDISTSQSWYYLVVTQAGSVFSNIAVTLACRAYLYDL